MITKVFSGNDDNSISYWNLATRAETLFQSGHSDRVNCLKMLMDGTLASGSNDNSIIIWNVTSFKSIRVIYPAHSSNVLSFEQTTDGYLISGSDSSDGSVKIWNTKTGATLVTLVNPYSGVGVTSLKMINRTHLAAGHHRNSQTYAHIIIWDVTTNTRKATFSFHTEMVNVLELLANGYLASGSNDNTVKIFNMNTLTKVYDFNPFSDNVNCLKQIMDKSLAIGGNDDSLYFWNVSAATPFQISVKSNYFGSFTGWVNSNYGTYPYSCQDLMLFNNRLLVSATTDNAIKLINVTIATSLGGTLTPLSHSTDNIRCLENTSKHYLLLYFFSI